MLKRIRQKVMGKLFGNNTMLHRMLGELFRTHPLRAAMLSAYILPVRNILRVPDDIRISKRTFTVSKAYYSELHKLLHIAKTEGHELTRTGRDNDGGYIMLDDFPGGIAYSFGICDDVSWDKDMASRGYDVYMYDHTIDGLPEDNPRFHWSKLGISDGVTDDEGLKTLEELISRNGHENERDMILKMDVEGAEWGFFESVKPETLSQFSQITLELHGMVNPAYSERILNVLRKINMTHQLIHLHANNNGTYITAGGKSFCSFIEASYVLRKKYNFSGDYDVKLPLNIDMPNEKNCPEIELGFWNRDMNIDDTFTLSAKVF